MTLIPDHIWGIWTVWQEARGESYKGKVAVAEVILRRAEKRYSSDGTIAGTVLRPLQFSGWNSKDPNRLKSVKVDSLDPVMIECIDAWNEAESGSNLSKGAVLYHNPAICSPSWAKNTIVVATIGNHAFSIPKNWGGVTRA